MKPRLCLGVSITLPLGLYWYTAAPGVTLVDSGELALACRTLGIAHPPGFPLYTVLGHLFSQLPVGPDAARRLNLFSGACAAVACGVVFLLVHRLLQLAPPVRVIPAGRKKGPQLEAVAPAVAADVAALAAALAFGFSLSLWSWAVVTEVYALNTLLLALLFLFAAQGRWPSAALAAGLALGVHHATVVMSLPAVAYLLWTRAPRPAVRTRWLSVALLALGLSVYLYLPFRAAQDPLFNWGDPRTLERFWWQISAKQYRVHLFEAPLDELFSRAVYFTRLALRQFTPFGFVLAGIGLVSLVKRHRRLFWTTALLIALNVGFALNYDIAEDIEGYYLPSFLAGTWCLAVGAQTAAAWLPQARRKAAAAALMALAALPAVVHFPANNRRHDRIAHLYVENTLRSAAQGALILTSDWQFYSPWLYRRYVEGTRPDVAVIDTLMMRRGWYLRFLERQYPELLGAANDELRAFQKQLDLFEHDLPYDARTIDGAFVALVEKLARVKLDSGAPVYFTAKMERPFLRGEPVSKEGLLYRVAAAGRDVTLDRTGLDDGSVPLDAVAQQVREIYDRMSAK